ncbi:hypothetical protein Tco_0441874 [Tanacetum coccineum]
MLHAAQHHENAIFSNLPQPVYHRRHSCILNSLLPSSNTSTNTSDSDIETLFDHVDSNVFDTYAAPETDSTAFPSNTVNIDVTPNNQLPHVDDIIFASTTPKADANYLHLEMTQLQDGR